MSDPDHPFLEYPLEYTFKIMGRATDTFEEHALCLVAGVLGEASESNMRLRTSSRGKYMSVSVNVRLKSEAERQAVYEVLHADRHVLYYF